ncbi:hypothetical protein L484_020598 [Morus notabilis]|uniref:Uncharacterized protein n=1 Tax=Morus notabilis TaxID=981085 RepID=W9SH32_9ROSA|nr:hypothetical protein L484_020598 [Morus notabilis]
MEPKDMMSYLQECDTTSVCHQIIFNAFKDARGAHFVLCNTVQELEPDTVLALQAKMPFYAIGPIFPTGFTKSTVATSLWSESDCTGWLNAKPHGLDYRKAIQEVKLILDNALGSNGSSEKNMDQFINDLKTRIQVPLPLAIDHRALRSKLSNFDSIKALGNMCSAVGAVHLYRIAMTFKYDVDVKLSPQPICDHFSREENRNVSSES